MERTTRKTKTLLTSIALGWAGCALLALPAGALPSGSLCAAGYYTWRIGTVYGAPNDVWSARYQAGDDCLHHWWQYPTTGDYTNSGCHPEVVESPASSGRYPYSCVCCRTVGIFGGYMSIERASAIAITRVPGTPVGGQLGQISLEAGTTLTVYHVEIQQEGGLIVSVDVNAETGEILPLPTADK